MGASERGVAARAKTGGHGHPCRRLPQLRVHGNDAPSAHASRAVPANASAFAEMATRSHGTCVGQTPFGERAPPNQGNFFAKLFVYWLSQLTTVYLFPVQKEKQKAGSRDLFFFGGGICCHHVE
jgi:hypothetical protein